MKKQIRIRDPRTGAAVYETGIDAVEAIRMARAMNDAGTGTPASLALVEWADALGHEPTFDELAGWFTDHGAKVVNAGNAESFEN